MTLEPNPKPAQMMSSGASTTIGTVWLNASNGYNTSRTTRDDTTAAANSTPLTDPSSSPKPASVRVVKMCGPRIGAVRKAAAATCDGAGRM
jgi:hypothetical protein